MNGRAYQCAQCDALPTWRLERVGDAVVTWSDDAHLAATVQSLQRTFERTEVTVSTVTLVGDVVLSADLFTPASERR